MKSYNIQQNSDKEMIISFHLKKSSLIFPILFISSLVITTLINIDFETLQNKWLSLTICFLIIGCIIFKDHFEWYKNRRHTITIKDEELYINNKFRCPLYKLKSINLCYINSNNIGWMIYLDIFPDSSHDYVIKKRLQEKEAREIAERISLFLDRNIQME